MISGSQSNFVDSTYRIHNSGLVPGSHVQTNSILYNQDPVLLLPRHFLQRRRLLAISSPVAGDGGRTGTVMHPSWQAGLCNEDVEAGITYNNYGSVFQLRFDS